METVVIIILVILIITIQNRLYRHYGLANLSYKCYFNTDESYEGDDIEFTEELSNAKFLPIPWLKSELTTSKWLSFSETQSVISDQSRFVSSYFLLKSNSKIKRVWKVKCLKRGVFKIDKALLVASDLFGSMQLSMPIEGISAEITVLPKILDIDEINIKNDIHFMGDIIVKHNLIADPFFVNGIHEYSGFEPLNRINWNATAREGNLMVKNNEFTSGQSVSVIFNVQSNADNYSSHLRPETMEFALKVSATAVWNSAINNIPVRLVSNSDFNNHYLITPESYGIEHAMNVLRIISEMEIKANSPFEKFLYSVCDDIPSTDIIIVTSYITEDIIHFSQAHLNVTIFLIGQFSNDYSLDNCNIKVISPEGGLAYE